MKEYPKYAWVAWPVRALLLVGTFIVCWRVLYPEFAFPVGLAIGGVVAALAITLEHFLTALLTGRTFARVIAFRLFIIDSLLAGGQEPLITARQYDKQQALLLSGETPQDIVEEEPSAFEGEYEISLEDEEIIDAEVVEER
jgi:hypothetical protein